MGRASVHKVDTTPYHLAIDLNQPKRGQLVVLFSTLTVSSSAPM